MFLDSEIQSSVRTWNPKIIFMILLEKNQNICHLFFPQISLSAYLHKLIPE